MKVVACMAIIGLSLPIPLRASCVLAPLQDEIASAQSVFVATITEASMSKNPAGLRDKEAYSVRYAFELVKTFKGDPSVVTALTTHARFDDPRDDVSWNYAEQTRLVPGDSVLVVAARAGDVPVSSIGCTGSRLWDRTTQRVVASILAPASN